MYFDKIFVIPPEVRKLTEIAGTDTFKRLEREITERQAAEDDEARSGAVAEMEAADAWLISELDEVEANIRDANQRAREADRAFQQARREAGKARAQLWSLRLECDRRKILPKRVLNQTVPKEITEFEEWLQKEAEATNKRLRTWKEPTGFIAKLTGKPRLEERGNYDQVSERLAKIREARDWCTRYREGMYLPHHELIGELQEWQRAIRAVWIR